VSTGVLYLPFILNLTRLVSEQLYQEQVERLSNPDGTFLLPTYEELKSLPVLDSVIRETLRMHPPIHSIIRYVRDDLIVPGTLSAPSKDAQYIVPKGHYVLASPAVSQVDKASWSQSDEWMPSRWTDPEGQAQTAFKQHADENGEKIDYGFGAVSKGTESPYQPFGAGRHRCIGEQFAYLQLGIVISTVVRNIEMRIPDGVPPPNYHVCSDRLASIHSTDPPVDHGYTPEAAADDHISSSEV